MAQQLRGMYDLRQELISKGVLVMQAGLYQFTQDYTFSSPSTAASVLLGRSANGRVEWKGRGRPHIEKTAGGGGWAVGGWLEFGCGLALALFLWHAPTQTQQLR